MKHDIIKLMVKCFAIKRWLNVILPLSFGVLFTVLVAEDYTVPNNKIYTGVDQEGGPHIDTLTANTATVKSSANVKYLANGEIVLGQGFIAETNSLFLAKLAEARSGSLLVEETFAYTANASINGQNGGKGWSGAWSVNSAPITATANAGNLGSVFGLTYGEGSQKLKYCFRPTSSTVKPGFNRAFTNINDQAGKVVWIGMVIAAYASNGPATISLQGIASNSSGSTPAYLMNFSANQTGTVCSFNGTTLFIGTVLPGTSTPAPHLVLFKISFTGNANAETITAYVDPDLTVADSLWTAKTTTSALYANSGLTAWNYTFSGTTTTSTVCDFYLDEFRIATSSQASIGHGFGDLPQTISFDPPTQVTYGVLQYSDPYAGSTPNEYFTGDFTQGGESSQPVIITSSDPTIASFNMDTGIITIHKAGTVTLTASQSGDELYAAALPVSHTLTIDKRSIFITAFNTSSVQGVTPILHGGLVTPNFLSDDSISVSYISSASATTPIGTYGPTSPEAITPIINDPLNRISSCYAPYISKGTLTITPQEILPRMWSSAQSMAGPRQDHHAVLLQNGKVLVINKNYGSLLAKPADQLNTVAIYDPTTNAWIATDSLPTVFGSGTDSGVWTATLLKTGVKAGQVFVTGSGASALYNPVASSGINKWTLASDMLGEGFNDASNYGHTATLLNSGEVFITGGTPDDQTVLRACQIYNPATNTWRLAADMDDSRIHHTATLLADGRVLVAGGLEIGNDSFSVYNPNLDSWSWGELPHGSGEQTATLLPNGKVLITYADSNICETWDPVGGEASFTGSMLNTRHGHTATLLASGLVLVTGGFDTSCELYDPNSGTWSITGSTLWTHQYHTATILPASPAGTQPKVLVTGSTYGNTSERAKCEIYNPNGTTTATSVVVTPATKSMQTNTSFQFSASVLDQFLAPMVPQPAITWSVVPTTPGTTINSSTGLLTVGATVGGPYTITASASGKSGTASVTVTLPNTAPTVATPALAAQNPAIGLGTNLSVLGADDAGEASLIYTWSVVSAPASGTVSFSVNGSNAAKSSVASFNKAGSYGLRATMTDIGSLSIVSNVTVVVNATATSLVVTPATKSMQTNTSFQFSASVLDQFLAPMVPQPAITWSMLPVTAGTSINATTGLLTVGATVGGPYTITASGSGKSGTATVTVTLANTAPTVATPALAAQNPTTGTTTNLSVLGADNAGEASLIYAWSVVSAPASGTVSFSVNGSNAAKSSVASFNKAGSYDLRATISDGGGLSVISNVTVTVNATATSLVVTPASKTMLLSSTFLFTAVVYDQFVQPISTQPAKTWSMTPSTSGTSINSATGLLTVGTTIGGPYTITAFASGKSGTSIVTVVTNVIIGQVSAWGDNSMLQVSGVGTTSAQSIAAGGTHSLSVKSDGVLKAWGDNSSTQSTIPALVVSLTTATKVAAGYKHSLAIVADTVYAWGDASRNKCNVPTTTVGASAIAAGREHSVALKSGGVICWGDNSFGQCSVPATANSGIVAIAAGAYCTLALTSTGTVIAWGDNSSNQLPPANLTSVKAIAAGASHTLVLFNNGTVLAYGANEWGQTSIPNNLGTVTSIAAGDYHSLAITSSGVRCWGDNDFNQCTTPNSLSSAIAIAGGGSHTVVVTQ